MKTLLNRMIKAQNKLKSLEMDYMRTKEEIELNKRCKNLNIREIKQ